ncbi:MAG TPA: hypothetical protein VFM39_01815 [bacterium]|nr:hypothetical protein [bacterium]
MTERDYFGFFLWGMAFMIAVGGIIGSMWPSLIRFVDGKVLKQPQPEPGGEKHWPAHKHDAGL